MVEVGNADLIHTIFESIDAHCISFLPALDPNAHDRYVWHPSTNGKFSLKKYHAYKFDDRLAQQTNDFLWNLWWKTRIHPQLLTFGWRRGMLPW